jgi:hypothetical protein
VNTHIKKVEDKQKTIGIHTQETSRRHSKGKLNTHKRKPNTCNYKVKHTHTSEEWNINKTKLRLAKHTHNFLFGMYIDMGKKLHMYD